MWHEKQRSIDVSLHLWPLNRANLNCANTKEAITLKLNSWNY